MTYIIGIGARIGLAGLVAAIAAFATCGEAAAKMHKHHHWHAHARSVAYESRAQLVTPPPARLGPMRYYGGPKSPMWRGPVEN
jgi:hypothetical protein